MPDLPRVGRPALARLLPALLAARRDLRRFDARKRLATATSVAICVVAEGAPLRDRSCGSLMEAAQVEVYSVDRKGYESFIAYAEGAQKLRLLEAFKNNWG